MMLPFDRNFAAQAAICIAVCIGAWMLLVKPQLNEIARLEASITENSAIPAGMGAQSMEQFAGQMVALHDRIEVIQARNLLAGDTSKLYGLLSSLADQHDVHVQNMQPGTPRTAKAKDTMTVGRIEITVDGPYDKIAWFIDDISALPVFIRPESLQLSPSVMAGRPVVTARLGFDILKFEIPPLLTGLEPQSHAQR